MPLKNYENTKKIPYEEITKQLHQKLSLSDLKEYKAITLFIKLDLDYIVSFIPIKNINNKYIGYVVSYKKDDASLQSIENEYLVSLVLSSLLLFAILYFLYYQQNQAKKLALQFKYFDTVFNTQKDIVVLTKGEYISDANNSFLEFLEYETLDEFKSEHDCICDMFEIIDKPDYIYKNKDGNNWVNTVLASSGIRYKAIIKKGGIPYIFSVSATYMNFDKENRSMLVFTDITELLEIQENLEHKVQEKTKELNRYIDLVDENILVSSCDTKGIITYASKAFVRVSGYKEHELIGQAHSIVRHPDSTKSQFENLWKTIKNGNIWKGEIKNRSKNNQDYWVDATIYPNFSDDGKILGYTAVRIDITDKKEIEKMSITDELTSLYNRRYFNTVFSQELIKATKKETNFAFIMMDIDNFKKYNDNYGHQKGDKVLENLSIIFRSLFEDEGDYSFRLGGEEFGAIFHADGIDKAKDKAKSVCESIYDANIEHKYNESYNRITVSIGLFFSSNTKGFNESKIYRLADEALYEVKENGRNNYKLA